VYNNTDDIASNELNTVQWKEFIKSLRVFRPYLYFTGGEPLIRDDIADIISYASSLHLLTHLNTNSSFLKEKGEGLIKAGLDFIHCSLDAVEPESEAVTGSKVYYQEAIAGIRSLVEIRNKKKSKFPIIQLFSTINEKNQHSLFKIAEIAEDLKVDVFTLSFPVFTTAELEGTKIVNFA